MIETNPKEDHKREWKGNFATATLHELVEKGTISALAAWLALVIDSFSKKRGCFASNNFLAKKIHKSPRVVQRLLEVLEKAKILQSTWRGKLRVLSIDHEGHSKQKREKKYRADSRARHDNSDVSDNGRHDNSDVSDTSILSSIGVDTNVSTKEKHCSSQARNGESPSNRMNGNPPVNGNGSVHKEKKNGHSSSRLDGFFIPEIENKKSSFPEWCVDFLYKLLVDNECLTRRMKRPQWIRRFKEQLEYSSEERIKNALIGYKRLFGYDGMVQAYSANTFCDEMVRIEKAIERIDKKRKKDGPSKCRIEKTKTADGITVSRVVEED